MTPERLREIEALFHEARERPTDERDAWLARACAGDPALRREVESLLAQPPAGVIDAPVAALVAGLVPPASMLLSGRRIGMFEVQGLLGVGGMGEVYRARDTRLGREVAIKILPRAFKDDPDRLARFEREARLLASLNHPHIGAIYGLEEADDLNALVMELVEGEDLAQRLARGALSLDEALPIARQIAEALEAAHEQSIVHRDLKPGNIKVREDGTVKVLDFGLAKALEPPAAAAAGRVSHSPTITTPAMTQAGVILGTAAYMSPEQAKGRAADRRSDIWAFGAVLFEMLTGSRAFNGEDVPDTLALILTSEPDWRRFPPGVPSHLRRLVRRCVERDPRRRLQAIGEARIQLEEIAIGSPVDAADRGPAGSGPGWRRALPWGIVAAALLVAVASVLTPRRTTRPAPALRLTADLGGGTPIRTGDFGALMILSPDSSTIAFVARNAAGAKQLYVRHLSELRATPLTGTEDADSPFFSPDGQWVGFFAVGKMKKVSVTGGSVLTVCDARRGRGGTWAPDGTIVFSPDARNGVVLMRVSSDGGTPQPLTSLASGEVNHRWPQLLPGAKGVLFTAQTAGTGNEASLVVQPLPSGPRKIVYRGGTYARYLSSGHLAFVSRGTLFAMPFDLDRLEAPGPPVRIVDGVVSNALSGAAQYDVSPTGTLVYLSGATGGSALPLQWMDRSGRLTMLRQTPAPWFTPRIAPDGKRIAMQLFDRRSDIWIYDASRDTITPLSSDQAVHSNPVWTPNGRRLVWSTPGADRIANLYWRLVDGGHEAQRLTTSPNTQYATSWHPSGRFLAFEERSDATASDLMILPMTGDDASGWKPGKPVVFANGPYTQREPMFSPDGRWIAYWSNESGRFEVYVRPFASTGGVWQISTDGGEFSTWSPTTRELFYSVDGQMWVASYEVDGNVFRASKPHPLSETRFVQRASNRMFDVHPDGSRFVLAGDTAEREGEGERGVVFVFDFFDELRRLVPAER